MVNCHKCGKPIKVTRDIHYDMMAGNKVIGKICKQCAKKENPNRPTKEYWGKVYPAVLKSLRKYGWKKTSKYDTIEEAAAAITASMWHDKLKPGTKAFYERIRRIREGKASERKKNWRKANAEVDIGAKGMGVHVKTGKEDTAGLKAMRKMSKEDTAAAKRAMKIKKKNASPFDMTPRQMEREEIGIWMRDSTEPYDDWEWDGKVLKVFAGKHTERYTRKDLEESGALGPTKNPSPICEVCGHKIIRCWKCQTRIKPGDTFYCATPIEDNQYAYHFCSKACVQELDKEEDEDEKYYMSHSTRTKAGPRTNLEVSGGYAGATAGVKTGKGDIAGLKAIRKMSKEDQAAARKALKRKANPEQVAVYRWGSFSGMMDMPIIAMEISEMDQLSPEDLLGFTIEPEHKHFRFFAWSNDIERTEDEGTGVKTAYGVPPKSANPGAGYGTTMYPMYAPYVRAHDFGPVGNPEAMQSIKNYVGKAKSGLQAATKSLPIEILNWGKFVQWWTQGLTLGLIRHDGKTLEGPDTKRFANWWVQAFTFGIIKVDKPYVTKVEQILDFLVGRFTLGLAGAKKGKAQIFRNNSEKKNKRLALLTAAEDRSWERAFMFHLEEGESESQADRMAWREVQQEFPRLKDYDAIVPVHHLRARADVPRIVSGLKGVKPLDIVITDNYIPTPENVLTAIWDEKTVPLEGHLTGLSWCKRIIKGAGTIQKITITRRSATDVLEPIDNTVQFIQIFD